MALLETWRGKNVTGDFYGLPSWGAEEGRGYTFRRDVFGSREEYVDGSEQSLLLGLRVTLAF
jgi:hypothetical protein